MFVELVAAILAFIGRMRDVNTELMRQLAHLLPTCRASKRSIPSRSRCASACAAAPR
jgi:hypothetical protein